MSFKFRKYKTAFNSGLKIWLVSGIFEMAQLFNLKFCLYLCWFGVDSSPLFQSRRTLCATYFPNLRWKLLSYFFWIIITENLAWKTKTKPNFVDKLCVVITFSGKSVVKWKPETKLCVTIRTLRWVLFLSSENIILYTTAV